MPPRAEDLNRALEQYVQTFPDADRLEAHLATHPDPGLRETIRTELRAVVSETEKFLWAQEGGVSWANGAEEHLFQHLRVRHPWLERTAFRAIVGFSKWICWHDGLNA